MVSKVPSLRTTAYRYNELSLRCEQIDAANRRCAYNCNARGDITETYAPAGDDLSWTFTQYDRNHLPIQVQAHDGLLSWQRDYFGTELQRKDLGGTIYKWLRFETPTHIYTKQWMTTRWVLAI